MRDARLLSVVAVILAVSACGGDDAPAVSTPDSSEVSSEVFFQDLASEWSAAQVDSRSYGVRIAFNGSSTVGDVFAEISYPGYDCAGTLTLLEIDGVSVTARETIIVNPGDICSDDGLVHLIRSESSLRYDWSYSTGELSDTATLFPG